MVTIKPLDPMQTNQSPVTLVNVFNVAAEGIPALMKAWEDDANWMK